jgi:protein-S-isoprenylcysteine O-methyltransferase Ste14
MEEIIWKTLFMIIWIGSGMVRNPHMKNYKKTKKINSKKILREKFLCFLAAIGMLIAPMIYIFTPWLNSFNIGLPDWARWIGIICFGLGMILFWWVHKTLGKNWSPLLEIRKDHQLITEGPYQYVRHPMYTVIWIWVLCQGIVLSNWAVMIIGILTWSILYFIRLPDEEKMMVEKFGEEYKDYMKKTKKIAPWIY